MKPFLLLYLRYSMLAAMKRRLFGIFSTVSLLLFLVTMLMIYRSFHGETWTRDGEHRIKFELNHGKAVAEFVVRTGTPLSPAPLAPFPAVPFVWKPSANEQAANFAAPVVWKHNPNAEVLIGPFAHVSNFGRTAITEWSVQTVNGGQMYRIDRFGSCVGRVSPRH